MEYPFTEEQLKQAAKGSVEDWMESLPDPAECTHVFSPRFERKMRRLIKKMRRKERMRPRKILCNRREMTV